MKYNRVALYLWVFITLPIVAFAGNADIWIERADMNPSRLVYIGDEIKFNIMVDTEGERITGVATYLTINPDYLQPVFPGGLPDGKPFTPGRFLLTGSAVINNTHLDSLHLYDKPGWGNGIDGFQLDYYQSTGPVLNGNRPSVRGTGVVASFTLRVVGMPENANDSTAITIDFKNDDNRLSTYYQLSSPSVEVRFDKARDYSLFIAGIRIYPEIPDTLIAPGTSLDMNLNDHVSSNSENFEVSWSLDEQQALTGAVPTLNDSLVNVTTTPTTKGVLQLKATAVQKNTNYVDSQVFNVGVDHIPVFHSNIPTVTFYEDEILTLAKSYFLSDQDDALADVLMIPGSSNLLIEDTGDSIKFSATANWYGEDSVELLAQDPVQQLVNDTIRTTVNINVLSVNDAPVLNLSGLDPISLFYGVIEHITLENGVYINDVDDDLFEWTVQSMDTENLAASFISNNILKLEALSSQFIGNVEIKVTATDDEGALDSTRINVYIQPSPVSLLPLPTIILLSGQSKEISLNQYVEYPEDIKSELIWSFELFNTSTSQPDPNVTLDYNSDNQTLTLTAATGHLGLDELYVSVTAGNENRDSGKTWVKILVENRLTLFPLPQVTIMQGMELDVLDLSQYVVDPVYTIDNIKWSHTGGDSLKDISIDSLTHIVTLTADTVFLGLDSVKVIASNPDGDQSAQWLKVNCIEYNPNPVFTTPLPDAYYYWKMITPQLYVDLDDYIWDFSTPDSAIEWRINYNSIYMDITRNDQNVVKISTFNHTGEQMVVFSATNLEGYTTSDTIIVTIAKLGEPVWRTIPPIEITSGQVYSSLYLNRFCLSAGNEVTYNAQYNAHELDVGINTNTTQVSISSVNGFSGYSSIIFYAANEDTSSSSNLVSVRVSNKSSVSCFFNSIVGNRVNFVINSDVAVTEMDYRLLLEGEQQILSFKQIDSTEAQKIWTAPYTFARSGLYKLNLEFTYANGLSVTDSLWLTTQLGTDLGKALVSSDRRISIESSQTSNQTGLVMLTETDQIWDGQNTLHVYKLSSNSAMQESRVKASSNDRDGGAFYGFYEVNGQDLIPMPTTTDGDGHFWTNMELDKPFVFTESASPAVEEYVLKAGIASYPNPFNSRVKIRYVVEKAQKGMMTIYNILGQTVYSQSLDIQTAGIQDLTWNSLNQYGNPVPTGLYFIKITAGTTNLTHKVMLLR